MTSTAVNTLALPVTLDAIDAAQVAAGSPLAGATVIDPSVLGGVEVGVWEHSVGQSRDVEVDEVFVVVAGRATVEVEDGPTLNLKPGTVGFLRAGDRTTWTVHEQLRKVYLTASAEGT
jgi:uncharacterized cupin superfamily protein